MPGAGTIDALLYDFGGVLVEIHFDRIFARWSELAGKAVAATPLWELESYQRFERGESDMRAFCQALRAELGVDLADDQFEDGWQKVFGDEIAPTIALARRLAPRIPQYVFSNTNPRHFDYFSRRYAAALEPFRRVFTSCDIGARKPERHAFEHVAREIGVAPSRILFFDDTAANLEGARALGMHTVLVRSHEDVARAVAPWLA